MKKPNIRKLLCYFSTGEWVLWIASLVLIVVAFAVFDRSNYLALAASLVGATSLIFNAKGNPMGQALSIVFSILYGIISYTFAYYGEMITYLGMTLPMAAISLIAWLKNPYKGRRAQVTVNKVSGKELLFMFVLAAVVTVAFYFILKACNTANIIPSTISVTTSFIAVYLTFRRSALYALGYAANDVVLIVLWVLATLEDITYVSVVACFAMFLVNDFYGFFNWIRMGRRQKKAAQEDARRRIIPNCPTKKAF